jgi:hypothetical protein
VGGYEEISSYLPIYEDGTEIVLKRWHIEFRRRGVAQKKAYNTLSLPKRPEFSVVIVVCLLHVVLTCYDKGINKKNSFQQSASPSGSISEFVFLLAFIMTHSVNVPSCMP